MLCSHHHAAVHAGIWSLTIIDSDAALPITVRLPGGDGRVAARLKATLRWRSGAGPWRLAGQDAALIPATATQVEVTPAGASSRIVTLRA